MKKLFKKKIKLTHSASSYIKNLIKNEKNKNTKFRIYITGGGCSGFEYRFKLEKKYNLNDIIFVKSNVPIIIDPISMQYLIGGKIDYVENLNGSKFVINNPNAKSTCSCGTSFNI
ncbi:MAG: iron-sulfur cluster insertion protein ErpA [Buchnera aphidicola (Periphyllus acericola)]|uniref:iron-sulfur cluster insertion protein ErpA n=1 Tax=Buchnera aphidicola TaxID=9 RepID=UPI0030CBA32C|nr:iron-sulfur cluster insertion protein ErpA [Buchnera aphidicola (Periphyllus acericola)]